MKKFTYKFLQGGMQVKYNQWMSFLTGEEVISMHFSYYLTYKNDISINVKYPNSKTI